MKRLFDDDDEFLDETRKISSEIETVLQDVFEKYKEYSARDIANLAHRAVNFAQSMSVIDARRKRFEKLKVEGK